MDAAPAPANIMWINQTPKLNHNFQLFFIKVVIYLKDDGKRETGYEDVPEAESKDRKHSQNFDDYFFRLRDDSQPRLRICFDPENEIPLLQKWFNLNNHPSRGQVYFNLDRDSMMILFYLRSSSTLIFWTRLNHDLEGPSWIFTTLFTGSRTPELQWGERRAESQAGIQVYFRQKCLPGLIFVWMIVMCNLHIIVIIQKGNQR